MGAGVGKPITPLSFSDVYSVWEEDYRFEQCAVTLPRYAQIINYDEPAFWGVQYEMQSTRACSVIWTAAQRMNIMQTLLEAQSMIESVLSYPLCPVWITGSPQAGQMDRYVDRQPYTMRQLARYTHVIEAGVRAESVIASGATVNLVPDPCIVGPIATAVTEADEVKVYHPDTGREITPSKITISAGNLTLEIPRARLVKQSLWDNPRVGIAYEVLENFTDTVDIKRVYNDPSTNAVLVRPHCQNNACDGGCNECTQTACMYMRNHEIGSMDVLPATYNVDTGEWKRSDVCNRYSLVRLNYRAGLQRLPFHLENAIVRLAHSLLPKEPCGCDVTREFWWRDRHTPTVLTRERLNCDFGLSDGAWYAWQTIQRSATKRMAVI